VRTREGQEVELESYGKLERDERMQRAVEKVFGDWGSIFQDNVIASAI
jgi:hypothetical protein